MRVREITVGGSYAVQTRWTGVHEGIALEVHCERVVVRVGRDRIVVHPRAVLKPWHEHEAEQARDEAERESRRAKREAEQGAGRERVLSLAARLRAMSAHDLADELTQLAEDRTLQSYGHRVSLDTLEELVTASKRRKRYGVQLERAGEPREDG